MEEFPKQSTLNSESAAVHAGSEQAQRTSEVPSAAIEPPKEENNSYKINKIKERLLEAGMVTIEPIQGDPFVLSREHVSTGEGVTTYLPDGTVQKISIEEYRAQLAKGRKAAQFFNQQPKDALTKTQLVSPSSRIMGWLKNAFTILWSKL
ncbi:MAG: hypothetical protein JWN90_142 [Parcubacteria group bacterium]|nr:hypothetical protein [Parcubacteria group bacterium]